MSPRVAATGSELVLLLPERRRFGAGALSPTAARRLGQGDRLAEGAAGERPQLERYFRLTPAGQWPMAAITRQADEGDAAGAVWLRADPVYLRPDLGGARLMAWANLGLSPDEVAACVAALRPLFEDSGYEFSAPSPERWYLRLPADTGLPEFAAPEQGLGDDVFRHLPDGADGRRWRALLNEAQVTLHNLPLNLARAAACKVPVNSVWFWGGGVLPDSVATGIGSVMTDEADLQGLSQLSAAGGATAGGILWDWRQARDWRQVERLIEGGVGSAGSSVPERLLLDFADGVRWSLRSGQRWRVWRRRLVRLGE